MLCKLFTWYNDSHCQLFKKKKKSSWAFKTNEVDPFETCVLLFSGNLLEWQSLVLKLMTQIGSLLKVAVSFYCLTASLLDALVVG